MPARQSSFPTSIVYDLTTTATITGTATTTSTITGTTTNMLDRDLATEYLVGGTGAGVTTAEIRMDFHREVWNASIYSKYDLSSGTTTVMQYSSNGTDWTSLDAVQHAATAHYNVLNFRYLRWYAENNGAKAEVGVYEVSVFGV